MIKLDSGNYDEVEEILKELISGEIKSACTMIEGVIITSSGPDFESGIDNAITAQLMVVGRTAEEALAIREKNFERMVITANSKVIGGFDIIIQRAGPEAFIIVESKGIISGGPFHYTNGDAGGTLQRINEATDKIAEIFYEHPPISDQLNTTKPTEPFPSGF